MAMTKKERSEMESLRTGRDEQVQYLSQQLRMAKALSWPIGPPPKPIDVKTELDGKPYGTLVVGWWFRWYCNGRGRMDMKVGEGCSSGYYYSETSTTETYSRGSIRLYRTEAEALTAMRHEITHWMAEQLATLDGMIEVAMNKPIDENDESGD